jgi:hypothetical protein
MPHSSRSRRRMDRKRFGPGGRKASGAVVTCGRTREEAVHRRVPLAAGSATGPSDGRAAKPATGEILVPCAGQRRPAARVGVETGLWRAVLRMREGVWRSVRRPGVPGSSTQGPARAGRCHPPLIAARVRAANKRHATACRMRTPSGEIRARARLRHPACHRESGACTPNPLPNGTACARPSGLSFPKLRRRGARRVFVRRSRAEPDHPFRRYSLS